MRLSRFRLTVRRMMIVIAIAAVTLGAIEMRRRRDRFDALRSTHQWSARGDEHLADMHASTATANEREAERLRLALRSDRETTGPAAELSAQFASTIEAQAATERAEERKYRDRARVHEALRIKYERAARYPWVLVPPDPPIPE